MHYGIITARSSSLRFENKHYLNKNFNKINKHIILRCWYGGGSSWKLIGKNYQI